MRKQLFFLCMTFIAFTLQTHAQNTSPYWSLNGNNNVSSSSKLGTTNSIPLRLMTNNSTRLYISPSAGYVGIGLTSPNSRLHINAASGTNALRAQVNGATKLLVHSAGGVSIGSGTTPPSNGLLVTGNTGIGPVLVPSARLDVHGDESGGVGIAASGYTYAVEATSNYSGGYSFRGNGPYIAFYGSGYGYGTYVWSDYTGVFGSGGYFGVYGSTSGGSGTAGYSDWGIGAYGHSNGSYGGEFASETGTGLHASAGSGEGSLAAKFDGNVYASGIFQTSDRNLKKNIQEFSGAMDIIEKLKPRNYEFKADAKLTALHLPKGMHYGLIAQDVAEVLPSLVSDVRHNLNATNGLDESKSKEPGNAPSRAEIQARMQSTAAKQEVLTTKAVNYTELIPIMVKGMQEQQQRLQKQEAESKEKDNRIAALQAELAELRHMVLELKNGSTGTITSNAYLEQNTPNPVNGTTTIRYYIPESSTSASIHVTNAKGQLVKTLAIGNMGTGQVSLNTSMLASGTYNYTLYVNGKQVDTKRFITSK